VDDAGIAGFMGYARDFLADPLAKCPPGRHRLNASLGATVHGDGLKLDWEPDGDWCPVYLAKQGVKELADFLASKASAAVDVGATPSSEDSMALPTRLLDGPMKVSGGKVLRVVGRNGNAVPESWDGNGWTPEDGSLLAEALTGRRLSPAELEELGID
jgi:hypothetical protein